MAQTGLIILAVAQISLASSDCQSIYLKAKQAYFSAPEQLKKNKDTNQALGVYASIEKTRIYYEQYKQCIKERTASLSK